MAGETGKTTSRILNRMQYDAANTADTITLASGDILFVSDITDDNKVGKTTVADLVAGAGITATVDEINSAADVSSRLVSITDANTPLLAANSGKPHVVANVSADRTFTLPTPASGIDIELIATVGAADGHDWIIDSGSDTNYFVGAIVHLDTDSDAGADELVVVSPDGNSNSKLQINLPQGGTRVRLICDGTLWIVSGFAVSVTAPAFADQ